MGHKVRYSLSNSGPSCTLILIAQFRISNLENFLGSMHSYSYYSTSNNNYSSDYNTIIDNNGNGINDENGTGVHPDQGNVSRGIENCSLF